MRRHRQELEIFSEMNLTNMLDTAFTLLLAFLLVAPMIKHGIDLELPSAQAGALSTEGQSLTIAIARRTADDLPDRIYIEDQRVTTEQMVEIIKERQALYPNLAIMLEADRLVRYETVLQVVAALRNAGIGGIGLPTATNEVPAPSAAPSPDQEQAAD